MNTFKRKALFTAVLAGLALTLTGCPSLPMSEQMQTGHRSEKDANINCGSWNTLPTDAAILNMSVDAGIVVDGELEVKCGENSVRLTNKKAAKP